MSWRGHTSLISHQLPPVRYLLVAGTFSLRTRPSPVDSFASRSRHPGHRLRALGLGGDKKPQDILVDAKVPARERGGVPLLCAGDQIAWVIGHCLDARFALAAESQQALHIVATRRNITATPDT